MRILNKEQEESMYRLIEQELELNKENNKLQQRIDKAIEYIENKNVKMLNDIEILRILKGE